MRFGSAKWLGLLTGAALLAGPLVSIAHAEPLGSPIRLALTPWGVAVSDFGGNRVLILDGTTLEPVDSIAIDGKPLAVAWADDRLLVGNHTTGDIEVYTRHKVGHWTQQGRLGGKKGLVPNPNDIAVDDEFGFIFALSSGKQTVMVFDFKGRQLYSIGGPGTAPGSLIGPTGVALDRGAQRVLVSDYDDPDTGVPARVQIYDYGGAHLASISGESGQEGFEFHRPQGLAVNGLGHIFVADCLRGQVLVFDDATLLGVSALGTRGTAAGQLLFPLDVAIDPVSMDVLVTNNRNGRLEVFDGAGVVP